MTSRNSVGSAAEADINNAEMALLEAKIIGFPDDLEKKTNKLMMFSAKHSIRMDYKNIIENFVS